MNPQGHAVTLCYNGSTPACGTPSGPAGSLQSVTNDLPTQNVWRFSYNPKGNMTSRTDAKGSTTGYGYDAGGDTRTVIVSPPNSGLGNWGIASDSLGRTRVVTDGKGQTATYNYDSLDRPTGVTYSAGPAPVGYAYDDDGYASSLTDQTGTAVYKVDALGRLEREDFPGGGFNDYDYDAASNLTGLTDGGGTTGYGYDGLNQLDSLTAPGDSAPTTFAYNADGARTRITYPSGVSVHYGYDLPSGRVSTVTNKAPSGSILRSFAYSYGTAVGDTELPRTVIDSAGYTTTLGYDALDRLTDANTGGASVSYFYTFDGNGNRTSQFVSAPDPPEPPLGASSAQTSSSGLCGTTSYAYSSGNLLCWAAPGQSIANPSCSAPPAGVESYSHDPNGNLLDGPHNTFTYNGANQTTSVVIKNRTSQALAYRGAGQCDLIQDGLSSVQRSVLGVGSRGATRYTRAEDGTLIDERTPSGRYNYLYDGAGSVVGVANGAGVIKAQYSYSPYGHPTNIQSLGDENPFGFLGSYNAGLRDAGVQCGGPGSLGCRYYDSDDGRFTQPGGGFAQLASLPAVPWSSVVDSVGDRLRGAAKDAVRYAQNVDVGDLAHAALGLDEAAHGLVFAGLGLAIASPCYAAAAAAGPLGWIFGGTACTVVVAGNFGASGAAFYFSRKNFSEIDLTK